MCFISTTVILNVYDPVLYHIVLFPVSMAVRRQNMSRYAWWQLEQHSPLNKFTTLDDINIPSLSARHGGSLLNRFTILDDINIPSLSARHGGSLLNHFTILDDINIPSLSARHGGSLLNHFTLLDDINIHSLSARHGVSLLNHFTILDDINIPSPSARHGCSLPLGRRPRPQSGRLRALLRSRSVVESPDAPLSGSDFRHQHAALSVRGGRHVQHTHGLGLHHAFDDIR